VRRIDLSNKKGEEYLSLKEKGGSDGRKKQSGRCRSCRPSSPVKIVEEKSGGRRP